MVLLVTSTEPYFVSEALFCPEAQLVNSRPVRLHVATLGRCLEQPPEEDDLAGLEASLRGYLPQADAPFILDIDLDFFSTRNPFLGLYERAGLYHRLRHIYRFEKPDATDAESGVGDFPESYSCDLNDN
ncbi:UPF0489 protein C5orf22 homolog [Schistocerca nitens]|uniref:UPF0489 protein C5orf22 homolog n=1 Tax=Schistocerca nitens TaxID=7011 RepID=UPI00211873D2|nr:UPF0489 protein C5orf22 homolog [Schistocerca nitens]